MFPFQRTLAPATYTAVFKCQNCGRVERDERPRSGPSAEEHGSVTDEYELACCCECMEQYIEKRLSATHERIVPSSPNASPINSDRYCLPKEPA